MRMIPIIGLAASVLLAGFCLHPAPALAQEAALFHELVELFPDSDPQTGSSSITIHTARGVPAGVHLLVGGLPSGGRVHWTVTHGGDTVDTACTYRLIDVPVEQNTGLSSRTEIFDKRKNPHVIRDAPFRIFEVLEPVDSGIEAGDGSVLALRFEVPIFTDCAVGPCDYTITLSSGSWRKSLLWRIVVHAAVVPPLEAQHLAYTNWFSTSIIAERHGLIPWSEPFFEMLGRYAALMARGRQNTFWIRWNDFISLGEDRQLVFHEKRFQRYVRLFLDQGFTVVEGGHLASRHAGDWGSARLDLRLSGSDVTGETGRAELATILSAVRSALAAFDLPGGITYLQHLTDEPTNTNAASYRALAEQVRTHLPDVKIFEATMSLALVGAVDHWCPQVQEYERNKDFFVERQQAGNKVWVYTCLVPGGPWLNRLLDQERLRQVYLGWSLVKYDLTGFLHWGLNHYRPGVNPFEQSVVPHGKGPPNFLPAGDSHVIYPGAEGPLSGQRFEAQRIGMEDAELLLTLRELDPAQAAAIIGQVFRGYSDFETGVDAYLAAKRALLEALSPPASGGIPAAAIAEKVAALDLLDTSSAGERRSDWLLDPSPFRAELYRTERPDEIVLDNGLVRRTFRLAPNGATVGLDNLMTGEAMLRAIKSEAIVVINGMHCEVGGLQGQPNHAYLRSEWIEGLDSAPGALRLVGFQSGPIESRFPWKRVRHHAPDVVWPPRGIHVSMDYVPPPSLDMGREPEKVGEADRPSDAENAASSPAGLDGVRVTVHYELYDGLPLMSKWITVHNDSDRVVQLDRFTSEILAIVEHGSQVGGGCPPPDLHVQTDYAFNGMCYQNANRWTVHWVSDPEYMTQVDYRRKTPCMLEIRPEIGPAQVVPAGEVFESFRTYVLLYDTTDRERKGLSVRRFLRTIAPWVTENPLMMHVRYADWETVKAAIDQCAEVGFEMVILTFGSGFNIENDNPEYLAQMQRYAAYARSRGIEIGGYSLLASRCIGNGHDVVLPEGKRPTFGNSPCLESVWGQAYFAKLYNFFETTGFTLLEHDGSYPGDPCQAESHPGHRGFDDSRWNQWKRIASFYAWCRERGIYLNVPDYYYLCGSNKSGMGYRETNWSLPRNQQVIHTRQNIYDGTWEKTPSMGWMFVPLTQYQGGGAAATIEPLDRHLDHYERMLNGNLAMGVQACYRGPRLFDTDRTKEGVARWVAWFKEHRRILESDLIHGRRADGRDIDWMLHVNPALKTRGMAVIFNPLDRALTRTIRLPLYYTGLTKSAAIRERKGLPRNYELDREYCVDVTVTVPGNDMTWLLVE